MRLERVSSRERAFDAASVMIGVLALFVNWSASSHYGLGIDGDGVLNLSAGVHFAHGRGLVTCRDAPLTLWPPLYPLVMAALEFARIDVMAGLRLLHLAAFAATLGLSARLAHLLSGSRWAALATLGSLALSSRVHEFTIQVMSEAFFAPLLLGGVLAARAWLEQPTRARWIALVALSALACLQRYVGVALVMTVAAALLVARPGTWVARAVRAAHYAALSVAPLLAWFVRNHRLEGAFTGGREAPHEPTQTILADAASTFARWIVPDGAPLWIAVALYTIVAVLVVRALRVPARRRHWSLAVSAAVVYLAFVIAIAATVRVDRIGDRLLYPGLPLLVPLAWASWFRVAKTPRAVLAAMALVFATWGAGATRLFGHWQRWRTDGAGTIHTRLWQEHALTRELRQRKIDGPCWSNSPETVWMAQRVSVRFLAAGAKAWERAGERASESGGTLAWFQEGGRPKGSLRELEQRVRAVPITGIEDGLLLRLEPAEKR